MQYMRMLDKTVRPSEDEILKTIGSSIDLWNGIHNYVNEHYDYLPELTFFTKKYGWTIRYRRKGKTLCYFFPEEGAFSVLIVLGAKEAETVENSKEVLNQKVRDVFDTTEQLRDGRWMWVRIFDQTDIASLKVLLHAKKKPRER